MNQALTADTINHLCTDLATAMSRIDAANAEITRLRTALEAVCFPHDSKTLIDGEWFCDECDWRGEECPTQVIVHAALDAEEAK